MQREFRQQHQHGTQYHPCQRYARRGMAAALVLGLIGAILGTFPLAAPTDVSASGAGNWNQTGDPLVPHDASAPADLTAVALHNGGSAGKVLLIGGRGGTGSAVLTDTELYDPGSAAFATSGALHEARFQGAAVELASGKVLVSGGTGDGTNAKATAELWDPGTGSWTTTGAMSTPRMGHRLFLLPNGSNKVLAVGGKSAVSGSPLTSTEIYDPNTGMWSAGANVGQATGAMAQLTGGNVVRVYPDGTVQATANGTGWSALTSNNLNTPRTNPIVVGVPGGNALVLGGYGAGGSTDGAKRMEVASFTSTGFSNDGYNVWTLGNQMFDSRANGSAYVLPDGTLLVFGGVSGTAQDPHPVLTTEKIDLKTLTATQVTPTQDDAIGPTTVQLANADVFSIGFREPGTNQQHHSLRYAAPAAQGLLTTIPGIAQFGPKATGSTNNYGIVTVLNYGGAPVAVSTVQDQGFGAVIVDQGNSCANSTVQPGQSCVLYIQFKPTASIPYAASVTLTSNAANGSTLKVSVYGTGSGGANPPSLKFGAQPVGATGHVAPRTGGGPVTLPVSYNNVTAATRTVTSVSTGGAFSDDASGCLGQRVAPGASCTINVTFTPTVGGDTTGTLTFGLDDNTSTTVPLDGVGTTTDQPAVTFSVNNPLSFGSQPGYSGPNPYSPYANYRIVPITNSGRAPLVCDFSAPQASDFTGPNAADFAWVADGTGQCSSTNPLQPGQTYLFEIVFRATTSTLGTHSATFYVHYFDSSNNPQQAALSIQGDVVSSSTQITSMQISSFHTIFGTTEVGTPTNGYGVVIRNTGNATLSLGPVPIQGQNASDFQTDGHCDFASIAPGNYCETNVTFNPTRPGYRYAVLSPQCTCNQVGGYLTGTGQGEGLPTYSYSGSQASYGTSQTLQTGTQLNTDVQQTGNVTITNTGTGVLAPSTGIISQDGSSVVSNDGSTIVAQGGGNIVAAGGGNLITDNGSGIISAHGVGAPAPNAAAPRTGTYPSDYVGDFALSTCQNMRTLEPGQSCTIAVRFAPVNNGALPAMFNLPLYTANSAHNGTTTTPVALPLTGNGVSAPKITSVPPMGDPASGGAALTISGNGFQAGAKVYFGVPGGPNGVMATTVTASSLTVTTPALSAGDYNVTVVNPDGRTSDIGRYHAVPSNFMPMETPHATVAPAVLKPMTQPNSGQHPTPPPLMGGAMPTATPLPQPGRH